MYNRYIPEDASYTRVEGERPPAPSRSSGQVPRPRGQQPPVRFPDFLPGKESLSGLLKTLRLDRIESGDILLLLIALYLWKEGDDPDLAIALGLVVLMGLGEDR